MLLRHTVKSIGRLPCLEYDRLTAERSNLRAAYIKHVAKACDILKSNVGMTAHKSVSESCAIHKERHSVIVAHTSERLKLIERIKRAVFGGMRNIYHSDAEHHRIVFITCKHLHIGSYLTRVELSVLLIELDDLVPGIFNGAYLVKTYMSRLWGDDRLVWLKHSGNYGLICLSSAHQEIYIGIGRTARLFYKLLRSIGMRIVTVTGKDLRIGFYKSFKHLFVRAENIIAFKR